MISELGHGQPKYCKTTHLPPQFKSFSFIYLEVIKAKMLKLCMLTGFDQKLYTVMKLTSEITEVVEAMKLKSAG